MNQFVLFHFTVNKNDRLYQFVIQPGAPWEDIEAVCEEFKTQFLTLKQEAIEKEKNAEMTKQGE